MKRSLKGSLPLQKTQSELALALRHIENPSIIAMGDSSVFGVGDHGDDIPSVGYGWTGRIAHDLKAKRFINVAKNGARARDLPKNQLPAALAYKPHITLICIGTNDALRRDFSPTEIRDCLVKTCRPLADLGSLVLFLGLPDPTRTAPGPLVLRQILSDRVIIINEILEEIAKDGLAICVPTWNSKIAHQRHMWHVDRMHPSALGHQLIADTVRHHLSLPRRSAKKLPTEVNTSRKFEMKWLITNGTKWFAKRSFDLLPALVWLMTVESIRKARAAKRGLLD